MEKEDIRKNILTIRESLSEEEAKSRSQGVCKMLYAMSCFNQSNWLYGYMPIRKEVDIRPFLEHLLDKGKNLALPRVNGDTMEFYHVTSFEDLEEGSFHILEPKEKCPKVEASGFILVPGVAFDRKGGRIGYGKGYYDKYFSTHSQTLEKLGIAYTIQIVDEIPTTSQDVRLHGLISEEDFWMFS